MVPPHHLLLVRCTKVRVCARTLTGQGKGTTSPDECHQTRKDHVHA